MEKVVIHSPIWKTNSIGIAHYKIIDDLEIEIDYKRKDGSKVFPNIYTISKEKALTYPTQMIKDRVTVHIIPINDLIKVERERKLV